MKAMVQERYGSSDQLAIRDIDEPEIGPADVLIDVVAAGVDRGVWHLMTGLPYMIRLGYGLRGPKTTTLGLDVSGVVAAVGSEVTRFSEGDEVFGVARGSFAERAAADEAKLAVKPAELSFLEAGVLAISGITAMQGLLDVGQLQSGQTVLILGASGGVGTYAVQLAKAIGAEVTGVCRGSKADAVSKLGADNVVDYETTDVTESGLRYDLVFDLGGRTPVRRLRRCLAPDGTLVVVGGEDGGRWTGGFGRALRAVALSPFVKQRLTMFVAGEEAALIERLADHVRAGQVRPVIDTVFPLAETAGALQLLESGRLVGKAAIQVAG